MSAPRSRCSSVASAANDSCIAAPARTARSASSSRRTGMPKTAMRPSPVNFTTRPACCGHRVSEQPMHPIHHAAGRLRVEPFLQRGRAGQVREQDRDDFADRGGRFGTAGLPHRSCRTRRRSGRRPRAGRHKLRSRPGASSRSPRRRWRPPDLPFRTRHTSCADLVASGRQRTGTRPRSTFVGRA